MIEKAPTEDHPCALIRTSERISFPALKNELFVNFLGYKEPNLVHVMRCRGVCGDVGSLAPVACRAVQTRERRVMMMFRTNSSGRDSKHRMKELILDEHVECGCQCLNTAHCVGMFNEATCGCECEEERFGERRQVCESRAGSYWESSMCRCLSKSVETRGLDYREEECSKGGRGQNYLEHSVERGFDMLRYIMVGVGLTLSLFLSAASCHYKRKYEHLKMKARNKSKYKQKKTKKPCERRIERHVQIDSNGVIPNSAARRLARKEMEDLEQLLSRVVLPDGGGDLYHEQYNEHGVKIERQQEENYQ